MVKVVKPDFINPGNYVEAHFLNLEDFCELPFLLPSPLGASFPRPIIEVDRRQLPVDYFAVGAMPIVSERLRSEIEAADAQVEFFEVDVWDANETPIKSHPLFFAHLLKEIDCFDYVNSIYETRRAYVTTVSHLVLHAEQIGAEPVFLIHNVAIPEWIASDDFADKIQSHKFRGIIFLDPSDYLIRFG